MNTPKVLIVNQPFDTISGGGITLSNLFTGYEKEKLAVVCSAYLISEQTNFEICSNYYQIGHLEYKWRFPFNLLKRKHYSGRIKSPKANQEQIKEKVRSKSLRMKLINDVFYPTLKYLGLYYFSATQELSKELRTWLDEYDPDILYGQASSKNSIQFCKMIQNYINKPLIFHMMDDWPATLEKEGLFGNYWSKKVKEDFEKLFKSTKVFLAISDLMSKEYGNKYGNEWITFHNPIDIGFWKEYRKSKSELNSPPEIMYAGRVGTGIDSSLETIAQAVEIVNENFKIELKFVLQTPEAPDWVKKYRCVKHNSYVEYRELPRVFAETDILILPYDFDEKGLNFIRLSMPTKASEYFASGTPVIIFSPESTALVDYANRQDCALTVFENDSNKLAENIVKLIKNEHLRLKLAERGVQVAEKYHNADIVRITFRNILKNLHVD